MATSAWCAIRHRSQPGVRRLGHLRQSEQAGDEAAMRLEDAGRNGHSAGTAASQLRPTSANFNRAQDGTSGAPGPRLLGVEAAAAYLGVSHWTVRDLIANGTLARV